MNPKKELLWGLWVRSAQDPAKVRQMVERSLQLLLCERSKEPRPRRMAGLGFGVQGLGFDSLGFRGLGFGV